MRFELQMFVGLITLGLLVKRVDWRGMFFLLVLITSWVMFNWIKG
jgi:hypothetical protein